MLLPDQFLETPVWGLPIVVYPFLSGLMAGAFVIASLSHLFGLKQFNPIAKLAAVSSFGFVLLAAVAPLVDTLQPSRAWWELYARDHFPYSPLGVFIIIWTLYVILMLFEMYFDFRIDNIEKSKKGGIRGAISKFLSLGSKDISEKSKNKDKKALFYIAAIGVPLAFAFHGYIGFVFGAIKARALWTSSVMMVMFITSAIVSGTATIMLFYIIGFSFLSKRNKVIIETLDKLGLFLMYMIFIDLFVDLVDWLYHFRAYASADVYKGWVGVYDWGGQLAANYHIWQILLGLIIPAFFLAFKPIRRSKFMAIVLALLVNVGVWEMRYNTVIGGQLLPKIGQGFTLFHSPWTGFDGILSAIGIFSLGLVIIFVLGWLFGWEDRHGETSLESDK